MIIPWDVVWNAGWRSLLNQMTEEEQKVFEKEHLEEIAEVVGNDGVWFNTEVYLVFSLFGLIMCEPY